ncbi:F-box/kelch-repeat protein At5g60570-like [Phragmites australis]|uniref:F-box/kelch-repeat protein At5g60570-like n=1 Tax=Phragmites australis TaxID=29695 RepID=UPI002D7824A6|nr:F-box/kelch-repeat protein At5g60570-like [Phragmites australis]
MEDLQDCNSKSLVALPGSVVLHLFRLFGQQDQNSWQKYILAYFLLVRNEFSRESKKQSVLIGSDVHCCDISELDVDFSFATDLDSEDLELQKQKPVLKIQSGGDSSGNRSNDCFFPGLHDDLAQDCVAWTSRSDYPSLSCLNKRFNLLINSGYLYKLRRKYGIIEHWVYLACSLMPWEAFDPSRKRWMRLPRMPCDECFSCADKESLAVGTQLLVFGREYTGLAIWMYNLLTRNWSQCTPMNLPRCLFASGSSGEIAIVAGGCDSNGHVLKSAELYNSETGHWETLPDMNLARRLSSGFFMDGKFYVIGGVSSQRDSFTCGEEYTLETRSWRRILDMYPGGTSASQSPPLVAVVNNQLYAADQSTNVVKKYDKANNTWNIVKPLPVRADSSNGWGLAFKACGDRLLVIGGHRGPRGEVILLHSWCPEDGGGGADWEVLSVKERAGVFVYNCAIMGC